MYIVVVWMLSLELLQPLVGEVDAELLLVSLL